MVRLIITALLAVVATWLLHLWVFPLVGWLALIGIWIVSWIILYVLSFGVTAGGGEAIGDIIEGIGDTFD